MTVEELIEILKKHDIDSMGAAYIDAETGCIDGYFNLKALAEELSAHEIPPC